PRDIPLLLCFIAKIKNWIRPDRCVDRQYDTKCSTHLRKFMNSNHICRVIITLPTIFVRNGDSHEPETPHFFNQFPWKTSHIFHSFYFRCHFFLCKITDQITHCFLFFGKTNVHAHSSYVCHLRILKKPLPCFFSKPACLYILSKQWTWAIFTITKSFMKDFHD